MTDEEIDALCDEVGQAAIEAGSSYLCPIRCLPEEVYQQVS